ncbi:MAG: monooxygenase, partial [Legionella sp.]
MQTVRELKDKKSPRICVIGAGPSGLAAIKNLQEQGLKRITVFEQNNQLGGNWVYDEKNTHSSVYETTHIISSKRWSQFDDFPMPADYADYPSHAQLLDYFNRYALHFDIKKYIRFNTRVLQAKPQKNDTWLVTFEDAAGVHESIFDYLLV